MKAGFLLRAEKAKSASEGKGEDLAEAEAPGAPGEVRDVSREDSRAASLVAQEIQTHGVSVKLAAYFVVQGFIPPCWCSLSMAPTFPSDYSGVEAIAYNGAVDERNAQCMLRLRSADERQAQRRTALMSLLEGPVGHALATLSKPCQSCSFPASSWCEQCERPLCQSCERQLAACLACVQGSLRAEVPLEAFADMGSFCIIKDNPDTVSSGDRGAALAIGWRERWVQVS